ncbi:MAG: hypothetical protein M3372_05390, partial [Verrucomicrobiota bacterium]|nr:hypothetical protein [Verrucomicrobiota bacterium]
MPEFFREHDGSRNNWTSEGTTARFVDACNAREAEGADFTFVAKSAAAHLRQSINRSRTFSRLISVSGALTLADPHRWTAIRGPRSLPC